MTELKARIDEVAKFAERSIGYELAPRHVGNGNSGIIWWDFESPSFTWEGASTDESETAVWLHIPAIANDSYPESLPLVYARQFVSGTLPNTAMGAPCALIYRDHDQITILNDQMGMARLYELTFDGFGKVWTSRPGLGHVFAGVGPEPGRQTWADMATGGWARTGDVLLGHGHQLRAGSRVEVDANGVCSSTSNLEDWLTETWDKQVPTPAEQAESMKLALKSAQWWPKTPIADLSGGKDSRVTAAAAISAGVSNLVKTVNSDTGEVDVASSLIELSSHDIEHVIQQPATAKSAEKSTWDRYLEQQRFWEGAFFCKSALRGRAPKKVTFLDQPRINGLGGEALQGGNFARNVPPGSLSEKPLGDGLDRMIKKARVNGQGTLPHAIELSIENLEKFYRQAQDLGLDNSQQYLDFYYNFSEMPFWSIPQANPATLLPYYSPALLPRIVHSIKSPIEYGQLHKDLLRELEPKWADIPFYKGSPKTRTAPWVWEFHDWGETRDLIKARLDRSLTYDPEVIYGLLDSASQTEERMRPRVELIISRVMWEMSFLEFCDEVSERAARTRARVVDAIASVAGNS